MNELDPSKRIGEGKAKATVNDVRVYQGAECCFDSR